MPVVLIYNPTPLAPDRLLELTCGCVSEELQVNRDRVWAFWIPVERRNSEQPSWSAGGNAPVVTIYCKKHYPTAALGRAFKRLQDLLATSLHCEPEEVFILVQRVLPGEVLTDGHIWGQDILSPQVGAYTVDPIGTIRSPVIEPSDDCWGGVSSVIELDSNRFTPESTLGLEEFSHVQVIFLFHLVQPDSVLRGSKHPRERKDWPKVGIFAQRAKDRPNRIGVSVCKLQTVNGLQIWVRDLDAIDGTPVLDIKPYIEEFGPGEEVKQPAWSKEMMARYFKARDSGP